ncbi:F-box/kelch-repeat protein At3g23880-like isoform X2 [Trifolium pratense]|uniref:F-box/kelch-repeat protein At3g23880-like isoform X2 n=1 Tax=Trifolium pratense TaxID=57577 RepID=UPI001E695DF7|nr:F-box/kelch-repeat protein At3g23880-like isoform X2 [Trifolium pratense]
MAPPPSSDADEPSDVTSSDPLTEDTTATKKRSLNSSTAGTLTLPSSSSNTPEDSLHIPLLPNLPFELIIEILCRLPVKSLMQFQCVHKSWKSLISDRQFAKKHLRMSTKDHHHLITTLANSERDGFSYNDYPLTSLFKQVTTTAMQLEHLLTNGGYRFDHIVGSCHGILCIAIGPGSVLLWNPSIRKFTKLPCLDETPRPEHDYQFSFGYDHSSDSYKVVVSLYNAIVFINGNRVFNPLVKVHTLGTNSWRTIQDFPSGLVREDSLLGKFVCGTINWLALKIQTPPWIIISLDLEMESYQEIVQPDYGGETTLTSLKLGVLRDCLCIFSRSSDTFTDIWLMKEYRNKESWIKLFRVPDIRDLDSFPYVYPLYVSEDDQVLLQIESELFVYNSRDSTFKDLNIRNTNGVTGTTVYHESLISPCF